MSEQITETEDVETVEQAVEVEQPEIEAEEVDEQPEVDETEQDTFPRDYVEKLRDESAKYRQRAQRADELAQKLHTAHVAATGRLQDPSDLEFDEKYLDDPDALTAAIDALLEAKPHLGKRTPTGNIGQGVSGADTTVDLAGILRSRA